MKRKWIIEVAVEDSWIEDGFDFERFNGLKGNAAATNRVQALLPYAHFGEITARILTRPERKIIKKLQGEI